MTRDELLVRLRTRQQLEAQLTAQLTVTTQEYAQAINELLVVGNSDTGQSEVCAQVLLSLHNSHCFHMDLVDLCRLDVALFQAALIAIRGRVMLMTEPHTVIEDGEARFQALWDQWPGLEIKQRYQRNSN